MPKVFPFKAVRASADKAPLVVSKPYDDYLPAELGAVLNYNPFSFLHIINPGYKFQYELDKKTRFKLVKNRYSEFKEEGVFVKETHPAFYLYRKTEDKHQFYGIIALCATADYENNTIKRHEDTLSVREKLFKDYLNAVGFNSEPVLLTHAINNSLDELYQSVFKSPAVYDFSTTDKHRHELWTITDLKHIEEIQAQFEQIPAFYIADGHHRSASSFLLAKQHQDQAAYQRFMCYLIPENQLQIYPFYRLVKGLNGLSKEDFLIALDELFRIQERGLQTYFPSKKHHFSMYLDGSFYSLYLRKDKIKANTGLDDLDAQILYEKVLRPIL
ncbi:MAG: DUF1015 domain-containing protein, partial [Flavobacteriaceae bacterium]|nr:DUF1015 domain-containing protein [Flavobacteriaceae bacterium]